MDLGISGLVSGFDWRSLVDQLAQAERAPQTRLRTQQTTLQNQQAAYKAIQDKLTTLQTAVNTLKDSTLFDSRGTQVADPTVATASASAGAASGSYLFNITQLATASQRYGTSDNGKQLSATSDVSGLVLSNAGFSTDVTAGTFTINGKQVTVATTDTLQQVFDNIAAATGNAVNASYDPNSDNITLSSGGEILLGSATDTSNFLQVAKLSNNGTGTVTSSNALGGIHLSATLSNANLNTAISDGGNGAGEFKINGVSISFDAANDSINNVLSRINSSGAGVTASYDAINDRFVLTSKATGDMDIALEDVTGNFLAATGLAGSTLNHGKNLLYAVNNGPQLVSQSNTITDASSGITGLSVTAFKEGASTTVSVNTDTDKIKGAINDFISAYNDVQNLIATDTASSTDKNGVVSASVLSSDHDAGDLASTLRRTIYGQVSGLSGAINQLADLGIDTNGNDDTITLSNSDQLDAALQNNLGDVQKLFSDSTNGLAVQLSTFLDNTIGDNGSVVTKQTDLGNESTDIDKQVAQMETVVQADRQRMIDEFTAMEQAQAQMNQQIQYLQNQKF